MLSTATPVQSSQVRQMRKGRGDGPSVSLSKEKDTVRTLDLSSSPLSFCFLPEQQIISDGQFLTFCK